MKDKLSRRSFLAASGAAAVAPMILPTTAHGKTAPSNRINIGCVGVRSMGHANIQNFLRFEDCRVVALCDVDRQVLREREAQVNDFYDGKNCKTYTDYRDLIAKDDIDAVMIATPDHWHAPIAIAAARAGKDIFCEKPITHTHAEGRKVVEVVEQEERIWQTGSWQRSQWPWRRAAELVRNGLLGEVAFAEVGLPSGTPYPPPNGEFQVPEEADYDMWCGPSPVLPFHERRFHWDWRWHHHYGGGQMMDWVGHHNDILHWALGEEFGGPSEVHAVDFQRSRDPAVWDAAWRYEVFCTYPSGLRTRISNRARQGVAIFGTEGWLFISRGEFQTSNPEWTRNEFDPGPEKAYESNDHWGNFLDCVKTRQQTITPARVAHRSITPGHLAMISAEVGAKLQWDPVNEVIIDNEAATKLLNQQGDKMPWLPWRTDWCEAFLLEEDEPGPERPRRYSPQNPLRRRG